MRQPEITLPLEGVPVRICHFTAAKTCREATEGFFGLESTDGEGYAVFTPPRPEGAAPEDNANYNVMLDVEFVEYDGCTLVAAPASEYGDVVQIGLRNRHTAPEFHNAHIAELWMMVESGSPDFGGRERCGMDRPLPGTCDERPERWKDNRDLRSPSPM